MYFMTFDTAWQLGKDKRDRYLAEATRRRRLRPRSPVEPLDPPERAA